MRLFEEIKNRTLRIEILVMFSALLCVTAISEIIYSSNANRNLILKFENEHYSQKSSSIVANWLNSYFRQIELLASILAQNSLASSAQNVKFADFEDLFHEGLKKTPFSLAFYVGFNDGSYIHIGHSKYDLEQPDDDITKNLPNYVSYISKKITRNSDNQLTETWEYLNDDFALISKRKLNNISIDPRKRPWYLQSTTNKNATWTDVYMFKSSKTAGLTVTSPIIRTGYEEPIGVIAIDFSIQEFKKLLIENVKPTANSQVRLINLKNEIIASTIQNEEAKIEGDHDIILPLVSQTQDEVLAGAAKGILGTGIPYTTYRTQDGTEYIATLQKLDKVPFSIIITTPQSDFIGDSRNIQRNMLLISLVVYILSVYIVFLLSQRISRPISQLYKSAKAIENMDLEKESLIDPPHTNILEINKLTEAMNALKLSVLTFSKYAPKDLVRKLLKNGITPELGGKTKEITMFFSHIDEFSFISEKLPAEYLVLHLSEYFEELTKIIVHHNGTIDKYIGDAIMAVWGAPNNDEDQVIHACEAALNCQKILAALAKKWIPLGKPPLSTKIGIHTGTAVVGNIGSRERMNFTAIGDSVNIASRLGGANKFYGTNILVSEMVEVKARNKILFRTIDKIAVKGRNSGVMIFEPLYSIQNADENYYKMIELCAKSKEAFELFQAQNFKDAMKLYTEIKAAFPEKSASVSPLIERCKEFIAKPPKDWDGVNHLKSK